MVYRVNVSPFLPIRGGYLLLWCFNALYVLGITPASWQLPLIQLILKKGSSVRIENYRPIAILLDLFKLWERLMEERLRHRLESGDLQLGSRKGMGASHALTATRIIWDNYSIVGNKDMYMMHVNLSKAYNRVLEDKLWSMLMS